MISKTLDQASTTSVTQQHPGVWTSISPSQSVHNLHQHEDLEIRFTEDNNHELPEEGYNLGFSGEDHNFEFPGEDYRDEDHRFTPDRAGYHRNELSQAYQTSRSFHSKLSREEKDHVDHEWRKCIVADALALRQVEKHDHSLLKKTREALQRRPHAFSSIWNGSRQISRVGRGVLSDLCGAGGSSRKWPPQLPVVPDSLKIPIEMVKRTPCGPEGGILKRLELDICPKAQPIQKGTGELFLNLKGILNRPGALSCKASPPQVLFPNSEVGQKYSVTVKVQNKSQLPRKIGVLKPSNKYLDVSWGIELNESAMISPGLSASVVVVFKPKSDESIDEILTIIVHGDGNIVVPINATSISSPILEAEDWDCGCSIVGQSRISTFEIANQGGKGRFWLVAEEEFNEEGFPAAQSCKDDEKVGVLSAAHVLNNHKREELSSFMRGHGYLEKKPFTIASVCFRLGKKRKISIQAKYQPTQIGFHHEKFVILCDNGEVRWIAIRGMGIDVEKQPIVNMTGEWTGPPCGLPTEKGIKLTMDCGDLLPGQVEKPNLTLTNTSCIRGYFFWSIRPSFSSEISFEQKTIGVNGAHEHGHDSLDMEPHMNTPSFELEDQIVDETLPSGAVVQPWQIRIHPAQGVLEPFQELNAHLIVEAPNQKQEFHSCVISLFVQQLENQSIKTQLCHKLAEYAEIDAGLRDKPLFFGRLSENMPAAIGYNKNSGPDAHSEIGDPFVNDEQVRGQGHDHVDSGSMLPVPLLYMELDHDKNKPCSELDFQLGELRHPHDHGRTRTRVHCEGSGHERDDSILVPTLKLQVWARTVPVQCWFNPPSFVGIGNPQETIERVFTCTNQTEFPIRIDWDGLLTEYGSVCMEPTEGGFEVTPGETRSFHATGILFNYGKVLGNMSGRIHLPFTTLPCSVPVNIEVRGSLIEALTPVIHFGVLAQGTEKKRTLGLKNPGTQKVTWRAQITDTEPIYEENDHSPTPLHASKQKQVLRVWPEWGTLEPGETTGSQLFLCSDAVGKIAATVEIRLDQNPDFILYILVFAETQAAYLTLKNAVIDLKTLRTSVPSDCAAVTLFNPTPFSVPYACREAIGTDVNVCQAKLEPSSGFVAPCDSVECKLIATGIKPGVLRNLFVPCCVDGMKEPLLIQIKGVVKESKKKKHKGMAVKMHRFPSGPMEGVKGFYKWCGRQEEAKIHTKLAGVSGGPVEEQHDQRHNFSEKARMRLSNQRNNTNKPFVMPICPKMTTPPQPKWRF